MVPLGILSREPNLSLKVPARGVLNLTNKNSLRRALQWERGPGWLPEASAYLLPPLLPLA